MLKTSIEEYGIYDNHKLRDFIYHLETSYSIIDEIDFFKELVNFSKNKNIPYHDWFKYREGFSHTLVRELIKRSGITKNEFILDPFCGSGTTIVEGAILDYDGCGIDINPLSAFISEVKVQSYSESELEEIKKALATINEQNNKAPSEEYIEKYSYVSRFYSNANYSQMVNLRESIDKLASKISEKVYNFLKCVFLCIIEETSDRARDGNGLKTKLSKIENVQGRYIDKALQMLTDIQFFSISSEVSSFIDAGDAKTLSLTAIKAQNKFNKNLGTIIYSPPYANSFDYFESYKMELMLGDYAKDMKEVGSFRGEAVESYVGGKTPREDARDFIKLMADEIESAIPEKEARTGKRDNRTRKVPKMIKGYFDDMEEVIKESSIALPKGKKCYIVVDQSAYLGKLVPTDLFLAKLGEENGFKVDEIIICRNSKTSGQQSKLYPYLNDSLRESIVVLEKK